ncbi:pilus assembly protein TadE [Actinomyces sp. 2119]|uniref:Pilus assembly protein TadE n=1 Tax=Actinomyces lilanjuaniae TaxID=2321394 RepID=A0ABM6Z656_9ACTO|nr:MULTISPECIES: TadE family type IV pilus minor pilin [Actinomyces]AYD90509.1 pilus assembly protein TadE [Actinomyces lilanjuaniae]RJF44036.1 pilus assembly protein TadE [Actinomyces sp. 2119]
MVTAELAVSLPAVLLVLLLTLSAVSAGLAQMRVADAARTAARQAAVGAQDVEGPAQAVADRVSLRVETGELTCVTASRPVSGPFSVLGLTVTSRACAYTEPGVP